MKQNGPESQSTSAALAGRQGGAAPAPAAEFRPCWGEIGVYGKGTCPELRAFVHCRNCPIYSNAGARLLDRDLPRDYRDKWTAHFAIQKRAAAPANTSALLFRLGAEWLALPTAAFQEVAERRCIHSLPHHRHGLVLGVANIRGELLICASLAHFLGLEKTSSSGALRVPNSRLLVASWDGSRLLFPVDEVHGTYRFNLQELKPPPATVARSTSSYTQGVFYWRQNAVGFLDADLLFSALNRSLM
jgi:chemotaxis-related protein WspD